MTAKEKHQVEGEKAAAKPEEDECRKDRNKA
eukprot:CAMPEP_0198150148 /NCGR_PEP_ID=MMETSP1443-20131203/49650_1 /TAXON_ID=186043 /ORGANISM="Entomoneis sp., Strain CCMP2396" /LENGTH=30 /DNA_ID= /DNA_START= /DNA_END= /DNA_ORIENTATION=